MNRPGTFTVETARLAAAASVAARLAKAQRPQESEPAVPQPLPTVEVDTFTARKIARVREQIDRVEALLDDADEPQAVDRFANALTRLYDLERILAGRPLPGSRRPTEDRAPRRQPRTEPAYPAPVVMPEPAPDTTTGSGQPPA